MYAGVPRATPATVSNGSATRPEKWHDLLCLLPVLGQPPVDHDRLAVLPDHHVGRLEVAVNDSLRVRVTDRLTRVEDVSHEPETVSERAALCEP